MVIRSGSIQVKFDKGTSLSQELLPCTNGYGNIVVISDEKNPRIRFGFFVTDEDAKLYTLNEFKEVNNNLVDDKTVVFSDCILRRCYLRNALAQLYRAKSEWDEKYSNHVVAKEFKNEYEVAENSVISAVNYTIGSQETVIGFKRAIDDFNAKCHKMELDDSLNAKAFLNEVDLKLKSISEFLSQVAALNETLQYRSETTELWNGLNNVMLKMIDADKYEEAEACEWLQSNITQEKLFSTITAIIRNQDVTEVNLRLINKNRI